MALGLSTAAANSLLDSLGSSYTWVKLHVGDPGAAATANAAGNTTRQQATWGSASGGLKSNTNAITWTGVSTSEDYTHFSVWSASTAGNFGFSGSVTANAVTSGDSFTIAIGDLDVSLAVAA
jgi:hypothetical protein